MNVNRYSYYRSVSYPIWVSSINFKLINPPKLKIPFYNLNNIIFLPRTLRDNLSTKNFHLSYKSTYFVLTLTELSTTVASSTPSF